MKPYSIESGLVGHYPFNGNANDESGLGNHGVVSGASLITDRFGYTDAAYQFDGIDDIITITDDPSLNSPEFTVSAWFYQEGEGGYPRIVDKFKYLSEEGYGLVLNDANDQLRAELYDNTGTHQTIESGSSIPSNSWVHGACTFDGEILSVYVDGMLADQLAVNTPLQQSSKDITIGNGNDETQDHPFTGIIDDVRIYNRSLIEEEVYAMYNSCTFKLNLPDTIMTCHEDSVLLEPGAGFVRYLWSTGDTTSTLYARETGTYYVDVTDSNGCTATDSTYINLINVFIEQEDLDIVYGDSVTLTLGSSSFIEDGLVGYWPLNGNADDESIVGNHGVVNGSILATDRFGNGNSCYYFDGQNDYIEIPSNIKDLGVSNEYTISFWVYCESGSGHFMLLEDESQYYNGGSYFGLKPQDNQVSFQITTSTGRTANDNIDVPAFAGSWSFLLYRLHWQSD
ncbi:MAG: LamG domain-containing protein [Bacteroidales bacterium]